MFRRFSVFAILLLLAFGSVASAAVIDDVARDFKPIDGYVIMSAQDDFLIDQDAGRGVAVGDLFSVIKPGEKVIHPVTKEVLGSLDEVKGLLQVNRVKSGYSYARPAGEAKGIERGDVVRRYENVSATFWDYTGQGESFYRELKTNLPALEWREYSAAQATKPPTLAPMADGTDIVFILRYDGLEVRGPDFQVIHAYGAPAMIATAPAASKVLPQTSPATPLLQGNVRWVQTPDRPRKDVRYEAIFPGYLNVGALPNGTLMADFVNHEGRLLTASTDGEDIRVFAVENGALTHVASGDTSRVGHILSVHWWQPVADGPLYVATTMSVELDQAGNKYIGHKAVGAVFRLEGERLFPVREEIPYILGAFDRDGDGRKELLLGQSFDRQVFFGNIRELRLEKGKIESSRTALELPPRFAVQGSLFADLNGDRRPEAISIRSRVLSIYDGDRLIYQSPEQMGGSLSAMTYELNPGSEDTLSNTEAFELSPVARDLDGDGVPEIIAVASDTSAMRVPGIGPGVKKSRLSVIKRRDDMFVRGTIGEELDTPIQGLAVTGDAVYFVSSESPSFVGTKGKSYLLSFPLK